MNTRHEQLFEIDPDIRKARTLSTDFYNDKKIWESTKERIFEKSWQLVPVYDKMKAGNIYPFRFVGEFIREPLLLAVDSDGNIQCLSNVCTHRGNILAENDRTCNQITCRYHGRIFDLNGKYIKMPEFSEVDNFPTEEDHLTNFPIKSWKNFQFISISPEFDLEREISFMERKIGFLNEIEWEYRPEYSREYQVNAHWALYCENYLEGFHVPFVHPDLNKAIDYQSYTTELSSYSNLQTAQTANENETSFDLPENHEDYGKKIAAYYFWVFPNIMFNFYPWGLSVNVVYPVDLESTVVHFITFTYNKGLFHTEIIEASNQVEMEDEAIVEQVQKGIQSKYYKSGRYAPVRELGIHHFHRLMSKFL